MQALARTLALLETGFPATSNLIGSMTVDTIAGSRRYTVIIQYDKHQGYAVSVSPTPVGQQVPALPTILTSTKHPK
jgi:hypothetical protein